MSFIETFGGKWKLKNVPSAEQIAFRQKEFELMQIPSETFEKAKAIVVEKGLIINIYEVSDGLYCAKTEFDDEMTEETQFRLDGNPVSNKRVPDGKMMVSTSSFANGEWVLTLKVEGGPEFVTKRTRSGDEILLKDSIGDVYIAEYLVPA